MKLKTWDIYDTFQEWKQQDLANESVSQWKYTLDLLNETGPSGCKPVDTPMNGNSKLGVNPKDEQVDQGRYQRLVGKLIYFTHTQPDISFAVSVVS